MVGSSVDDLPLQRGMLACADLNWEVDFCETGREALERIGSRQPDCVLLDQRLPDMSAFECFHAIRKLRGATPILMLIAQNDEAAVMEAMRVGVQDYLFKDARGNYIALLPAVLKRALRERAVTGKKEAAEAALPQFSRKYEYLFLGVSDGIILADENRIIESINPAACRMFGYEPYELTGRPLTTVLRPANHAPHGDRFAAYLKAGEGSIAGQPAQEVRGLRKGGQLFPLEVTVADIVFERRRLFAAVMRDMTERHWTRAAMLENEARFHDGAFDSASIGMALVSLEGKWLRVNRALCTMVGYDEDELLAMTFQDLTHPDDLNLDQTFMQLALAGRLKTYRTETRYFHKDGHVVPVTLSSSLVRNAERQPLYFIDRIEDLTRRKETEEAICAEKDLARTTLRSTGDAVITTDAGGRITYLNPTAERLTGWTGKEACGLPLERVFAPIDETTREMAESPVKLALTEGRSHGLAASAALVARDGLEHCIALSAAPIHARNGTVRGVAIMFHDVSEARRLSREIRHRSSRDALTGLYNRSEFELAVARRLQSAKTMGLRHALLLIDLDRFSAVNAGAGRVAGDQVLRQLAEVLSSGLRKSDTLARLDGDRFGILLNDCPLPRAGELAQHLSDTVRRYRLEWDGKTFAVGASAGLVAVTERSGNFRSLMRAADTACAAAKGRGGNCVQVFEPHERKARARLARIDWPARVRQALQQDRFLLYRQAIVPLAAHGRQHHEALLRYRDDDGRLLLPMAFIPAAEHSGLLPAVDLWTIRKLLRELPAALFGNDSESFVAVNVSGASLADPEFQERVLQELRVAKTEPARLCFEIAEAAAVAHLPRAIGFMQAVKGAGCRCALDDFGGSPHASGYLKALPLDYVKIDGAIVKGMAKDAVDHAVVESAHRIAQAMHAASIAKCVEDEEVLQQLRDIGVDYGQGFCLHMPQAMD
jgi:diguanylate cyclase (GGDEF)-like protein/PAS domain S-box-containing protein